MKILVAAASRHGSTEEIAAAIADGLEYAGITVEWRPLTASLHLYGVDAVVLGSAVYHGRWLREAREFVEQNASRLKQMPVWLFSSGPIGRDLRPEGDPLDAARLAALTGAREHIVFAGKLDANEIGFGERFMAKVVRAEAGDFRDWTPVRAWSARIAGQLRARASA